MKIKWKVILISILLLPFAFLVNGCSCSCSEDEGGLGTETNLQYTVLFYTNSTDYNSYNIPAQTVAPGKLLSRPIDPTREGYEFLGWYTDPQDPDTLWRFESMAVTKNFTLYAKWQEIKSA